MYLSFKDAQPQNRQMGCASHVNVAAQATYLRAAAHVFDNTQVQAWAACCGRREAAAHF